MSTTTTGHESPLSCPLCERTFSRPEHLQRHQRTHTNDRPYVCSCGRAFTRRDLLTRHKRLKQRGATSAGGHTPRQSPKGLASQSGTSCIESSTNQSLLYRSCGLPTHSSMLGSPTLETPATLETPDMPLTPFGNFPPSHYDSNKQPLGHGQQLLGDPVHNFAEFAETMGLGTDWNMFPVPLNDESLLPLDQQHTFAHAHNPRLPVESFPVRRDVAATDIAYTPTCSPAVVTTSGQLHDVDHEEPSAYDQIVTPAPSWNITSECHNLLVHSLEPFCDVLRGFILPSRHALTRYLSGYFDGFHSHVPFVHIPTFRLESCAPELFLAMFSVGAQYRFENNCGLYLFDAAKAVSREQATRRRWKYRRTGSHLDMTVLEEAQKRRSYMQTVSALLLLVAFATWQDDYDMLDEAIGFQSVIANCLRHQGFSENKSASQVLDWRSWSLMESDRRVKLISFCYLTLHSITYNIPPALSSEEIDLRLPCSSAKWNAKTATDWREAGGPEETERGFRETLHELLASTNDGRPAGTHDISPLGNLVLIHALLQRVFTIRQLTVAAATCTAELLEQLERALHRWKMGWQRAPESSLDPQNPSGPIPFTSTAILALAHVRLAADLGPHRALASRDPASIAAAIIATPPIPQSPRLVPALLHSVHMLSVLIKLGINFVAKSQHFFWSVQHCVCSLECAVFLSRWLCQIGISTESLGANEQRLLVWTRSIIQEAQVDEDIPGRVGDRVESPALAPRQLGWHVIRIWATIFKGGTSWSIVTLLGDSLDMVSGMLEKQAIWVCRA